MCRFLTLLAVLAAVVSPLHASNAVSLGYSDETTTVGPERECSGGTLVYHHDGSFETAYGWQYDGVAPPYYGAFGEAYDLGSGTVACGAFWLACLDWDPLPPADCYVWEGGINEAPGSVLGVVTDVDFHNVPYWPALGQNDVEMNMLVTGPFTIGYWGDFLESYCRYFCGADLDGPPGHPWTCIAPGIGYPSGWQDPSIVWGPTSSMGCGAYFESNPTPAESNTWGSIKAMFR